MSPYILLFNNHVGNVVKRFGLAEKVCGLIMNKFSELRAPMAHLERFIDNYGKDTETCEFYLAKIELSND